MEKLRDTFFDLARAAHDWLALSARVPVGILGLLRYGDGIVARWWHVGFTCGGGQFLLLSAAIEPSLQ